MKPAKAPLAVISVWIIGFCCAHSAGVAVLKEQPYHDNASANAVVFTKIFDSSGPYLRIVSGGKDIDILRSNLAGRIDLPDGIPASIMDEKDLAPLRETLADVKKFIALYPRSAPLLKNETTALVAHIGRFDAGEVRFEGAWMSKSELAGIKESRRGEIEAIARIEVEKLIFEAGQREKGLLLHGGKWMTRQEIERLPPGLTTELSESIEPLGNGDLQGAKFAVSNLTALAARQTGAPKVRTERLTAVVRNLFFAEVCLNQRIIASVGDSKEAATHEKNAAKWLIPNAFGTVRSEESRQSSQNAAQIRKHSAELLAQSKRELMDQLREADVLTEDFHKLQEYTVVLILTQAVRAVSSRHFTSAEFRSSFPEKSLVAVRERILRDRNAAPAP